MDKNKIILILLILAIFILNYSFLDSLLISFLDSGEKIFIERVIDGDTVVSNGSSIRLLGINTPEKGELYSAEAKEFLEKMVLEKNVTIKTTGKDRYYRDLSYLFINGKNVNLEIVKNGFANFYFPSGKDEYYNDFLDAWENCLNKNINFCSKSLDECGNCIELLEWDTQEQKIILRNNCGKYCDIVGWSIKDEGRKTFVFEEGVAFVNGGEIEVVVGEGRNSYNKLFWEGETYVWTRGGDTLFLRDKNGGLVLWKTY